MLCRSHKASVRAGSSARPSFSRPARSLVVVPRAAAAPALAKKDDVVVTKKDDGDGEVELEHDVPDPKVTSKQVASFLSTLVEETSIAELHLKVGSFDLKVRRSSASRAASHPSAPAAAASGSSLGSLDLPPVAPSTTPALESIDESLVYVNSPKVGVFRRGKYAAGKRVGKGNMVNEGDQIKKGQPLGYVEQLGTHFPIESPQAGEVAKFMLEEGAPVEYQQLVVEIAPFFGGHIIGDKKYV